MFEKLISDVIREGYVSEKKPEKEISLLDNSAVFPSLYKSKLQNIDELDENELYEIVDSSIEFILENIKTRKNDYLEIVYFQNVRFLNTLINVLYRRKEVDARTMHYINLISYQYKTSNMSNPVIDELMEKLCIAANRKIIAELCMLIPDLGEKLALDLSSAFLIANDELKGLFNLNKIILKMPENLATEQNIIFIYESLGDYMRLSNLLKSVMFDCGLIIDTKKKNEIMSTICLAVLNIINSQNYETIRSVLIEYSNSFNYSSKSIRFSMRSINGTDFGRIVFMINILTNEGIIVP